MGVSFKISKAGRRFRPKPILNSCNTTVEQHTYNSDNLVSAPTSISKLQVIVANTEEEELEASFTLNLLPDGYSIGRPSENQPSFRAMLENPPKFVHPYDRTSETLFSAIESGRLPGDILDDIPCKYEDGTVVCEVRDYRNCSSEAGLTASSHDVFPITNKVRLRMSLENVVKDIPLISDNTWTYGDLIEFESRILKTLQPQLCLDPASKLDRLCENPVQKKLNLDIRGLRKRRREMLNVIVANNNLIHGKKVCIDRVAYEGSISGNLIPPNSHENAADMVSNNAKMQRATNFVSDASLSSRPIVSQLSKYSSEEGALTVMRGRGQNTTAPGASSVGHDMMTSYRENINSGVSSVHAKRDTQDDPLSPVTSLNKRARVGSLGPDGNQMGAPMDSLQGSDLQWNHTLLHPLQLVDRGFQYPNNGFQKFPQQNYGGGLNQEAGAKTQFGMRFPKEEPVETDKSEVYQNRNDLQQRVPSQLAFMRSNIPQPTWNTYSQPIDNNLRKEDQLQKRKLTQSHCVFGGSVRQFPMPTKSEEFSSGSGATSLISSANDNSMQRQQQGQLAAAKRRSNSLPKNPAMSGIGSPACVGNMSAPINANSPADETLTLVDPMVFDRFRKIELVATRHQINRIKNKVDEKPITKPAGFSTQEIIGRLNESSGEHFIDESENKELAKSHVGGSMNACKTRVLTFVQNERIMQGNGFALVPKSHVRMMLSADPSEGTIGMHYEDISESESIITEEFLPTFPNIHLADLFAAQLSSLMTHEGYEIEDKIYPKPIGLNHAQQNGSGMPRGNAGMETQQYSDAVSGQQPCNEIAKPTNSSNISLTPNQNVVYQKMLPPQNPHGLQISQGFLPTMVQQNEPQSPALHRQTNQLQRSPVMFQSNQIPQGSAQGQNPNALLGSNQKVYKPTSQLPIQLLHQHQQLQQQQQSPRKMRMGMGGNMGNNAVGLGRLGNVMGIGGPAISGMGQNPMNIDAASNISNTISQQLRNGQLTPQAMIAAKIRIANRGMMGGGTQSSLGGIPGAIQMHPGSSGLSMLGHPINRVMNPTQRSDMGPPKVVTGMNFYMNPQFQQQTASQQQQQMQMQSQQIQQQQQFQQQQLQQHHDPTSPLQAVVSPPQQQGSPQQTSQRTPMSPQQMSQQTPMSSQQMSQRTPMSPQLSSGAMHSIKMGSPEACPASPQLSSQTTLGSVSSVDNSRMDQQLPGVNKNTSVGKS